MSFRHFSEYQYIRAMDTGEMIKLGGFKLGTSHEIGHMRVLLFINGTLGGSEQLRVNIYSNRGQSKKIFHSSWSSLNNTIENENGTIISGNWLGLLRFDFDRQNINKNFYYYASVESNSYTRNGNTFYLGFAHDYPFPRYSTGANAAYESNLAFEIFGYE